MHVQVFFLIQYQTKYQIYLLAFAGYLVSVLAQAGYPVDIWLKFLVSNRILLLNSVQVPRLSIRWQDIRQFRYRSTPNLQ